VRQDGPVLVEHRCADGSPFPVTFAAPEDADETWRIDLEHAPDAQSVLARAVGPAGKAGEAMAYERCGLTMPASLRRVRPVANGFAYHLDVGPTAEDRQRLADEVGALRRRHGGALGFWTTTALPHIEATCAWIRTAPPTTPFAQVAGARELACGLTQVAGIVGRADEMALAALLGEEDDPGASAVALDGDGHLASSRGSGVPALLVYDLAIGADHETGAAERSVAAIAACAPGSPEADAARARHLDRYGERTVSWTIDHPTVAEDLEGLDAQVRALRRRRPGVAPDAGTSAAERRDRLAASVRAGLADDDARATFDRRLDRLRDFVPIREGRAHWQLVATGALRTWVRRRGAELAAAGVLDDAADVFHLTPDELDAAVLAAANGRGADLDTGVLAADVAARRADLEHWRSITPPATIGAPPSAASTGAPGPGGRTITGIAGSGGVARGRARIVRDLVDADRLEAGDVLVTTMTSPPWTPLFAIVAAVVTDGGSDGLSHAAIAAREHGIPCVLGTHDGTTAIPGGSTVEVDGDHATVRIVAPS
jgi:phosphohistidine swiveling domain-containing protein